MALYAIALEDLIGLYYEYSVEMNLNFNTTKSYCVAFTHKLCRLALLYLHINHFFLFHTQSLLSNLGIYLVVATVMMQKC